MMESIARDLNSFVGNNSFIYLDFNSSEIELFSKTEKFRLQPQRPFPTFYRLLFRSITENQVLITYNCKDLFSKLVKDDIKVEPPKIIDLFYLERYSGIESTKPKNLAEALVRLKKCSSFDIHQKLHIPLATKVIPEIENHGINYKEECVKFPFYEIEGQKNGRMLCFKKSDATNINPHTLDESIKNLLTPRGDEEDKLFVVFDYTFMELKVLGWLAEDSRLYEQNYEGIYEEIFDKKCESQEERSLVKRLFLPCIFGLQVDGIAKRLNFPYVEAERIYHRLKTNYKKSFEWIEGKEDEVKRANLAVDHFGRKRDFSGEPNYKCRSFFVQSPSATICLLKLIELHKTFPKNIVFSIHDGYVLKSTINDLQDFIPKVKSILELPFEEKLQLQTSIKVGINLADQKEIRKQ